MKHTVSLLTLLASFLFMFSPQTLHAQGSETERLLTVRFHTQGGGIERPDGFAIDQSAFAELWVGKNPNSLQPVAGPVRLNQERWFDGGTVRLSGYKTGDTAHVQLKVCFGDNFDDPNCCGVSPISEFRLNRTQDFNIHPSFFGGFTVCTDCIPDDCFELVPTIELKRIRNRLRISWLGGRLESATNADEPFKPLWPGLYFLDTGTHEVGLTGSHKFFRVVDPCINPDPVDWDADYIQTGLISEFWEALLERTLKVMGEPSLQSIDSAEDREVYRMFFLPSFGPSTVVRFERNGNNFTKRVVMTGAGYSPLERCILYRETNELNQTEWQAFLSNFDRLDFWSLGPENPPIQLLDGAPTFIEARKGSDYHIIERPTPDYKTGERGLSVYRSFFERWVNHNHLFF